MPDVVKHAWTHRPRSQGGTDPIQELHWAHAYNQDVGGQTVTATTELEFSNCRGVGIYQVAEPGNTFSVDPADPAGVLISQPGIYMAHAQVHFPAASAAVSKVIYLAWNFASNGPLASVGSPLNPGIGLQSASSADAEVSTIPKISLSHWAISNLAFSVTPANPFRIAVTLQHNGVDYSVSSSVVSNLTIVRLSSDNQASVDFTP